MLNERVNKAYRAYRSGDYEGALRLYHELGSDIGHKSFYANIALCLDKLNADTPGIKPACMEYIDKNKFDLLSDFFTQNIVVSLTSYPARINAVVETIKSLLAQSFKIGRILLWLAREQFPGKEKDLPRRLLELEGDRFSIEWCGNIGSYKKLIPALKKYPDKIIVTADDDILYEKDWLAQLVITHVQEPSAIVCHRAHRVSLTEGENFSSYTDWDKWIRSEKSSFDHMFTGCGGVLYPPGSLHESVLDEGTFTDICPSGDDLWFWSMAVMKGTRVRLVKHSSFRLTHVPGTQATALWLTNVKRGGNDSMLQALGTRYPEIREKVSKEDTASSKPRVSIIVPVFNTGEYLAVCLDSIVKQDFRGIEVLCINDGSTDELTKFILEKYRKQYPTISVIEQINSGPATARNTGLQNARGEYIAFVDSDDYISGEYIGNLYENIQRTGADIAVASQIMKVDGNNSLVEKRSGFEFFRQPDSTRFVAQAILTTGVSWNKLYKRKFLLDNSIRYLDGMRCHSEDNYFTIMALIIGRTSISVADNSVYYYRQHDGGITKNFSKTGFDNSIRVYEEALGWLERLDIPDKKFWMNIVGQRALIDLRRSRRWLPSGDRSEVFLDKKFASRVDICCIADENYIIPTLVCLESIKRTKHSSTVPSITVLVPQGTRQLMSVFEDLSADDFCVKVLEVATDQFEGLHRYKSNENYCSASPSAMLKFIIPSIFPDIDRILYLDTDLIVRKDLVDLFMTNLNDEYLCAVADMWSPVADRQEIKNFKYYFNSGVMLMNLSKMRDEGLPGKLIEAKISSKNFNLMDQDVFNEVCDGRVKKLDIKFNFLPVCFKRHKRRFDLDIFNRLYGSNYERIEDVAADPVVVHWAGSDKPWVTKSTLFSDEWGAIQKELQIKGYLNGRDLA